MSWFEKYLRVYEKEYDKSAFREIVSVVCSNLKKLQSDSPLVTISVIAYNEERHLLACLWALSEMQTNYPVEIIGVDNDSTDKTAEIFRDSGIPFYTESQHSCGHARLCGLRHARGKYHVNIDADTLYPSTYINTVIDVLERSPMVVGVSANWSYIPDEYHGSAGIRLYEMLRNVYLRFQAVRRPELSVRGMVFSYRTEEALRVGIRTHIIRGEDGALALGLKEYGKIAFIYGRKARAVTGYGTVGKGALWHRLVVRLKQIVSHPMLFFTSSRVYEDRDYNLIKRK